jgi:hypothetical protein
MRARPLDVSKQDWDREFELYRGLTPEQRLEMARQMTPA